MTENHKHKFVFSSIKKEEYNPITQDSTDAWDYTAIEICSCGKTKERYLTSEELDAEIARRTCKYCFSWDNVHSDPFACLPNALERIKNLEDKLAEIAKSFDNLHNYLRRI